MIVLLLIFAGVGAGAIALLSRQAHSTSSKPTQNGADAAQSYPYSRQKYLFTLAETTFYHALQNATQSEYLVFGKVRVADVLKPQTDNRGDWQRAFNKISAKHFDFVLCDRDRLTVLAAVELDDSSHQRGDRIKRDDFLNQVVKSAGLPLIRFAVQTAYDREAVQRHIAQTLGLPPSEKAKPEIKLKAKPETELVEPSATPKPKPKPKVPPTKP
nr:DUF2726 domain-containing protein [Nodosilinea sp. FACHB-131]